MSGSAALDKAGIPVPGLKARDGLAAINAPISMNGIGWSCRVRRRAVACAGGDRGGNDARRPEGGTSNRTTTRLHQLRGFPGAVTSAANIRKVIRGSDLTTGKRESERSRTRTACARRRR